MEKPLLKFPVKGSVAEYGTLLKESPTPRAHLELELPSLVSACNSTSEDTELHAFLKKYGNLVTHVELTDPQYNLGDDIRTDPEPDAIAPVSFARLLTTTMPNVKSFKLHYLHKYPVCAFAELLHDWAGTLEELDMGFDHLFGHVSDYKYMFGVIAELRNLKTVNVNSSFARASVEGIPRNDTTVWFFDSLFQAVDSVETLEVLYLSTYNFSISDESPLAKLLRQRDSSRRRGLAVSLDTPHDLLDEQLLFLRLITAENARVSKFKLLSWNYSDADSLRMVSALLCSRSLKEISLPCDGFKDTDSALTALRALGNHEYVEKLKINLPHDNKSSSKIVQAMKSITGLKELHIDTSSIQTIRPILQGLSACLSLEKVVIEEDDILFNPPSSESVEQFVRGECEKELQDSLQQLKIPQLKVVSIKSTFWPLIARHDKLSETTQFWLKMNRVGRKALVGRPEDHQAWGKALIENKSDLDVSYYLFRNNPDAFLPCLLNAACTADTGKTVDASNSLPPRKKLKVSNP